ncbi:MAG: RES family NAD+ phosphorylase [Ignavibacteria bacterium]|nr:RES family NAD+ phosphorylase [Ignavibacteria bacterium]
MEVFRICNEKYSGSLIPSGTANRWNGSGQRVLYAGSTRSLATLELVVHRNTVVPEDNYKVLVISIADDDRLIRQIKVAELPDNWRTLAAYSKLQSIGSEWYKKQETLVLKVPSAVIPAEYNYVVNTEHPHFRSNVHLVRAENYFWDDRLL